MKFIVRDIIRDDVPIIYNFLKDREIAYLYNSDPFEEFDSFKERYDLYFNNQYDDLKIFIITIDNRVIGKMEIGYDMDHKTATFDILIGDKTLWGKGYASKALKVLFSYVFNNLGLNRLSCEVYDFNERMLRLMNKMNMHVDGMLRDAAFIHDRFVDIFIFSKLRKEYEGDVYLD
ncbi:MAG TPA: GNAT family protein [Haloplasmataceae bacterium]